MLQMCRWPTYTFLRRFIYQTVVGQWLLFTESGVVPCINLLSAVVEGQMYWTLQVVPAAVSTSPPAAASPAGSSNELDDIPAVRFGRGPTCTALASIDRQRPGLAALLNDVSLHSYTITIPTHSFPIIFCMLWASRWQHRWFSTSCQSVVCLCKHMTHHIRRCSFARHSAQHCWRPSDADLLKGHTAGSWR